MLQKSIYELIYSMERADLGRLGFFKVGHMGGAIIYTECPSLSLANGMLGVVTACGERSL